MGKEGKKLGKKARNGNGRKMKKEMVLALHFVITCTLTSGEVIKLNQIKQKNIIIRNYSNFLNKIMPFLFKVKDKLDDHLKT